MEHAINEFKKSALLYNCGGSLGGGRRVITSMPILEVHATARKNHLLSKQTTLNPQFTRVKNDTGQTHSYPPKLQKTYCSQLQKQPITIGHTHRLFSVNLSHKE
jgi:hypothetical protein